MQLEINLIYGFSSITSCFLPKIKKRANFVFQNAFYNLFWIFLIILQRQLQTTASQKQLSTPKEQLQQKRKILLSWYRIVKNWQKRGNRKEFRKFGSVYVIVLFITPVKYNCRSLYQLKIFFGIYSLNLKYIYYKFCKYNSNNKL